MRTLTTEEINQVTGAGGEVSVLSDILSNILNDTLNGNSIFNNNQILNFTGNKVGVSVNIPL
jgi:hypothetical protein